MPGDIKKKEAQTRQHSGAFDQSVFAVPDSTEGIKRQRERNQETQPSKNHLANISELQVWSGLSFRKAEPRTKPLFAYTNAVIGAFWVSMYAYWLRVRSKYSHN